MTRTDLLFRLSLEKLMTMISMMKRRSKRGDYKRLKSLRKGIGSYKYFNEEGAFLFNKRASSWRVGSYRGLSHLIFSMRLYLLRHWRVLDRIWWLRLISPSVAEYRRGCASRTASSHTHFLDVECSIVMFFVKRKWNGNWLFFFFFMMENVFCMCFCDGNFSFYFSSKSR